ncbi:MAG: class I SAM-dependent methyltransferase, partial [Burkholderiales bacterium]
PPAELRYNVVGPCTIPEFLRGGDQTVTDIESALNSAGMSLAGVRAFLDFGCGCGRLMLGLRNRGLNLSVTGSDVDERAVAWCRKNIGFSKCIVNNESPPAPFDEASFDLIWCGSVFTHLDHQRQDQWLAELSRILQPNGILLASVHGPYCWEGRLPSWTVSELKRVGMVFARMGADTGIHPAWYQVAWHTEQYVREHWASFFEICGYIPRGFNDYQDLVVARKRD